MDGWDKCFIDINGVHKECICPCIYIHVSKYVVYVHNI